MRYDEHRAVYRDCRWCGGAGCLQCPGEAKKAYEKAFPNGPVPMVVVSTVGKTVEQVAAELQPHIDSAIERHRAELETARKMAEDPEYAWKVKQELLLAALKEVRS